MPLQIRRGTDAERSAMTQPLAAGELLYVTNTQKIYVGDNATLGGIQVTGYTDNDAKNATAAAFAGGSHSSISFSYNTTTKTISANVDLSNYQGVIKASAFTGSVFADDGSTLNSQPLVDAISGTFNGNLVGNVTGNVTGTVTGNIFTNLIDSANSSAISFTPSVVFNSDVTVENELFATLTGNVRGNVRGNIETAIGETIINNTSRVASFANVGIDTNGSVFGNNLFISGGPPGVTLITEDTVFSDVPVFKFQNNNTSGPHTASVGLLRGRGTILAPAAVTSGDEIGDILSCGFDGVQYLPSTSISTIVDGPVSVGVIPSRIEIYTTNLSGVAGVKLTVGSTAVQFTVPPKLPVVADDTARTALVPTPTTGMMIFMTAGSAPAATNKVQVYDSTAWVNLH